LNPFLARYHVLDLILLAMLLEGAGLVLLYRLRGRGIAPAALLPNLASGMCLILAMRLYASGVAWPFVSLALLGALGLHVIDVRAKWAK
jgi:hypothetical protein